jgi:hypothetical protein
VTVNFAFDLLEFEPALKIDVQDIENKRKEFDDGKNKLLEELKVIEPILSDGKLLDEKHQLEKMCYQRFLESFKPFGDQCTEAMTKFVAKLDEMKADIKKVGEMFGENPDYKTKDFLTSLINFAGLFKTINVYSPGLALFILLAKSIVSSQRKPKRASLRNTSRRSLKPGRNSSPGLLWVRDRYKAHRKAPRKTTQSSKGCLRFESQIPLNLCSGIWMAKRRKIVLRLRQQGSRQPLSYYKILLMRKRRRKQRVAHQTIIQRGRPPSKEMQSTST